MGAKQMRGFAVLKAQDPERLRAVAAMGGAAMPADKRSFSKSAKFAAECGKKGGAASRRGPAK